MIRGIGPDWNEWRRQNQPLPRNPHLPVETDQNFRLMSGADSYRARKSCVLFRLLCSSTKRENFFGEHFDYGLASGAGCRPRQTPRAGSPSWLRDAPMIRATPTTHSERKAFENVRFGTPESAVLTSVAFPDLRQYRSDFWNTSLTTINCKVLLIALPSVL
jgi:hypothetical protein